MLSGRDWLHWLSLHLVLVGGVSQLVLGAGQFFACAFLATDPPSRRVVTAQIAAWNLGTALVAIGVPTELAALFEPGAASLAISLLLFALSLRGMKRRSLQRAPWALRWYQASAASPRHRAGCDLRTAGWGAQRARGEHDRRRVCLLLDHHPVCARSGGRGIASGRVPLGNAAGHLLSSWVTPASVLVGALAVATSA